MTREQCKENLEIIKAYADGKIIQFKKNYTTSDNTWHDLEEPCDFNFNDCEYRIKPEETYRPYKDTDEMIADYNAKINVKHPNEFYLPLIWIQNKFSKANMLITSFCNSLVGSNNSGYKMNELLEGYTYLDGTPIGVKE